MSKIKIAVAAAIMGSAMVSFSASAAVDKVATALTKGDCATLVNAIAGATPATGTTNYTLLNAAGKLASKAATGGYGLPMWVTLVDTTGAVCAVTTTASSVSGAGGDWGLSATGTATTNPWGTGWTKTTTANTNANDKGASNVQWLASRVISAQKANTANSLSVDGYAISTANLYTAVLEGNSLYGLQHSNPVNAAIAYGDGKKGNTFGTKTDPLVGKRPGGINVFGGGLALYKSGKKIGAVGVSGDTSCRDHAFAWVVRESFTGGSLAPSTGTVGITNFNVNGAGTAQTALSVDGGGSAKGDEMIFKGNGSSYWEAWAHPTCPKTQTGRWSISL